MQSFHQVYESSHEMWATLHEPLKPSPGPIGPSLPVNVELGLTITFITLYAFLFALVYIQLLLILYYGHKRFSYQTVFLFLCLVWAGVRITLFSFYFNDTLQVDNLNIFCYWFFFCFPVCLQFITLCLLVLYFAQVLLKLKTRNNPPKYKRHMYRVRVMFALTVAAFLAMNIVSAIMTRLIPEPMLVVPVRVILSGLFFVVSGGFLAYLIWKLSRMHFVGSILLETRGASLCQTFTACVFIVLLYVSRAVYNIIAIATTSCPSFGYNWINVSDQADMIDTLKGLRYLSFGVVLFIWEFLPTFIVVVFFRVRKFAASAKVPEDRDCPKTLSRAYFFDNPHRYDSDDDLTRTHSTIAAPRDFQREGTSISSMPINSTPHVGYGTIVRSSSYPTGYGVPGTTPPMLFAGIPGRVSIAGHRDDIPQDR